MKTKAEAEAKLAAIGVACVVSDVAGDGITGIKDAPRRRYVIGQSTVEIDADPSPEQLAGLARHMPVAKQAAAREAFGLAPDVKPSVEESK